MSEQKMPSLVSLSKQLEKVKCTHLMGREVIEKQIVDIAMGKMNNAYCQNWDRCPTNGWGKCSPDIKEWAVNLEQPEFKNIFTAAEIEVIAALKTRGK